MQWFCWSIWQATAAVTIWFGGWHGQMPHGFPSPASYPPLLASLTAPSSPPVSAIPASSPLESCPPMVWSTPESFEDPPPSPASPTDASGPVPPLPDDDAPHPAATTAATCARNTRKRATTSQ